MRGEVGEGWETSSLILPILTDLFFCSLFFLLFFLCVSNGGSAPCDTNANLKCAETIWRNGGNSFKQWSTCSGCGCCSPTTGGTSSSCSLLLSFLSSAY